MQGKGKLKCAVHRPCMCISEDANVSAKMSSPRPALVRVMKELLHGPFICNSFYNSSELHRAQGKHLCSKRRASQLNISVTRS